MVNIQRITKYLNYKKDESEIKRNKSKCQSKLGNKAANGLKDLIQKEQKWMNSNIQCHSIFTLKILNLLIKINDNTWMRNDKEKVEASSKHLKNVFEHFPSPLAAENEKEIEDVLDMPLKWIDLFLLSLFYEDSGGCQIFYIGQHC